MSEVSLLDPQTTLTLNEFAERLAEHQRNEALLALTAARLEAGQTWALDGSISMRQWMQTQCRMSATDAARLVNEGRFLANFPTIAEAATTSVLSKSQVTTIRSHVPKPAERFLHEQQTGIVTQIANLTVRHGEVYMARWRQYAEALLDEPEPTPVERQLNHHRLPDGSSTGTFHLDAAGAEELERALGTAARWDGAGDDRNPARKRGDAFFEIIAFFNKNHDKTGTPRHRPHVELVVEHDLNGNPRVSTTDSRTVNPCTATTWMCDALYHRLTRTASNHILDYGVGVRSFPFPLFRAIAARDGGCRFPGCDRPIKWCDCHHVNHHANGGDTSYNNGCLLCSRHHHLIHQPGWHLQLDTNADLHITRPDGTTMTSHPPPIPPTPTRPPPDSAP